MNTFQLTILFINLFTETFSITLQLQDFIIAEHEGVEVRYFEFTAIELNFLALRHVLMDDQFSNLFDCGLPWA